MSTNDGMTPMGREIHRFFTLLHPGVDPDWCEMVAAQLAFMRDTAVWEQAARHSLPLTNAVEYEEYAMWRAQEKLAGRNPDGC